jgi:hypothetical protein
MKIINYDNGKTVGVLEDKCISTFNRRYTVNLNPEFIKSLELPYFIECGTVHKIFVDEDDLKVKVIRLKKTFRSYEVIQIPGLTSAYIPGDEVLALTNNPWASVVANMLSSIGCYVIDDESLPYFHRIVRTGVWSRAGYIKEGLVTDWKPVRFEDQLNKVIR